MFQVFLGGPDRVNDLKHMTSRSHPEQETKLNLWIRTAQLGSRKSEIRLSADSQKHRGATQILDEKSFAILRIGREKDVTSGRAV